MCGIVGLITKAKNGFMYPQQKIFYQMLMADEVRGADATGVIGVENNGDFHIMKQADAAYEVINDIASSQMDKDMYQRGLAYIGHNRAKTVGVNKDENSHPFVVDKTFAMVHNGTLRNHDKLHKTDVDSEALAKVFKAAMDEEDWKTALEKAIGTIQGAFAVVWYDQKRNQVCLLRNSERPLGMVTTNHSVLFGSEMGLLAWVAQRNGEKVDKWIACEVHKLYTFDLKEGNGAYKETFLSPKYQTSSTTVLKHTAIGYNNGVNITPTAGAIDKIIDVSAKVIGQDNLSPKEFADKMNSTFGLPAMTKSGTKRLRADIFRKRIKFVLEDFVEGAAGTYFVMGMSVDGAYDICEIRHEIKGQINIFNLQIDATELMGDFVELTGVVTDVLFDKTNATALIYVDNIEWMTSNETVH